MKDYHSFYNVSVHAMKAYVGVEIYFLSFVTWVLKESDDQLYAPVALPAEKEFLASVE
jgi:hypothetical protein